MLPFLRLPFSLGPADLATHLHIMGLTGMGKSKLLAQFASQLILQGQACTVIDPHADLVDDILLTLLHHGYYRRPEALRRVLFVDFADPNRFVPFNVLKQPYSTYEIARNLVEACTRAWPSLAGGAAPQLENLLLAAVTVLVENDLPLTTLPRLLTDQAYRTTLLERVRDPLVLDYFRARYDHGSQLNESTLRRAFLLAFPPPLRYSLGQRDNLLNLRSLMDRQVSLLVSLGGLDAQTQRLLGCLLLVGLEQAALSRADLPPAARRRHTLFVDEFAQFSATSEEALERVLALTRKYGLFLVLAHQTWGQARHLQSALQNAAFLTFRAGADDLAYAAARVGPINPYQVKYATRTHLVYASAAEQRARWEYAIARLPPREALLRIRGRTVAFTTEQLPRPTPTLRRELARLRETYAQRLLIPRNRIFGLSGTLSASNQAAHSELNTRSAPPNTAREVIGEGPIGPEDADHVGHLEESRPDLPAPAPTSPRAALLPKRQQRMAPLAPSPTGALKPVVAHHNDRTATE